MRDVDAGERELTGETQALHSRITKLEQVSHNLPGHKNVDEELDRAWREWKSTFDAIEDSVILTDGKFKIIQANLASSQLFGRPLDQVIGKTCWQLVHGTNEAPEGCPLKRAKDTKKHEEMEVYLPQKGIWAADSVDPVLDEQGRLTGVVHIIRDITDRKQAEESLRKERDRAQKYLDVAGVMLVAIDAEQRVGLINKKGCEILGYSEEEITAKNWFDNFLPKRIKEDVKGVFNKLLCGESDVPEYYENPVLTKDGAERLIAWHNTVLRDDKGKVIATLGSGEDITKRKEMEEVLRESEEKYRALVENSPNLVAIYQEGALKYVNKIMCEKLGWTLQEMTSPSFNPVEKIIPQRFRSLVKENIAKRLRRENTSPYEISIKTRDGSEIPVMVMGQGILYHGKPADEIIHIDITERKLAEEALRESEERFRRLYEQAPLGYQSLDAEACFIDVNQAWLDLMGYSRDQVIGHWFGDFLAPQEVDAFKQRFSRFKAAGEVHVDLEMVQRAGSTIIVHIDGRIAHDEHGQFKQTHCILHDITAQKRTEDALRETTQTLQAVIQASPLPIFAVDRERIVKTWNPAAERTFGWSAQEVIGRQFPAIPKEKMDEADALFSRAMESGLTEVETLRQRKDGSLMDVSISAAPLRDSRGNINGVMAVITDITERKKAEQKLLEDQAQLKSLASQLTLAEERERRRLATKLHDRISQSLVSSKIKLDALRKSDKALEDVCNSIGQTIQDTRTLTFDLSSPVLYELGFETAVSEWLTSQIQGKHDITVEFEDDGEPKPLDEDVRILLFRDVRELLINVVKHASAHKVKVSIRKVGSEIHIRVEDDGWGFDTKKVAATAVREGGFGLFSIRERLGQLGGHLEIESEPGCGTKATLIAPLKQEKVNRKGKK